MMLTTSAKPSQVFLHEAPSYVPTGFRILCATDLSPRSEHAVERAMRLSEALGAKCMLLHIVAEDVPMRLTGRRAERAQAALEWHLRRLAHRRVEASVSVRVGDPYSTIVRAAKEWGADLIVLGSHRRRSADTLILSTAERISQRARRPVLVVNADARQDYSGVTFVARKHIGLYVQLADQLELFEAAHVSVVPHVSTLDRVALACSRVINVRVPAFASQLYRRVQRRAQRRTQAWIEEAGLHLLGFEIIARPITARLLLSRVTKGKGPQLLVAGLNRTFTFSRSLARLAAGRAVRTGACDVLVASDKAARAILRLPGFGERKTCEDADG
jgi:nucleotide-binding universal stress UspA family protein